MAAKKAVKAAPGGCCWKLAAPLPLLLALLLYLGPKAVSQWDAMYGYTAPVYDVPDDFMDRFRMYDSNGDGYMDPYEFFEFASGLSGPLAFGEAEKHEEFEFEDYLEPGAQALMVQAQLTPIDLTTMSKFSSEQERSQETNKLPGLLEWTEPAESLMQYGANNFQAFLPPQTDRSLGEVYTIIEDKGERIGVYMHSYHPPRPRKNEEFLHILMRQFHSNPFVYTRFGPRGTRAVVRARSSELLDVFIRSHVEFQLNESPYFPFWFTPAQFSGRLVVNTTSGQVLHFEMTLPTGHQLNIDMEWLIGSDGSNEVDIGYCPMMRLSSVAPSEPWREDAAVTASEVDLNSLHWDQEIPPATAWSLLEKSFYPFKEVSYLPYLDAIRTAAAQAKLVHLIMLWGALDDQSC